MSEGLVQPCLSCSAFKIMSAHDVPLEQDHIRLALLKTIQRLSSVRRLAHGPLRTDRGPLPDDYTSERGGGRRICEWYMAAKGTPSCHENLVALPPEEARRATEELLVSC